MDCPVCKQKSLVPVTLAPNLQALKCRQCEGIWVSSLEYFAWLREQPPSQEPVVEIPEDEELLPVWDTPGAKICPDCGHILARYKIWPAVEFYLDHCGSCNGVWFDRHEWQVLEERELHDNLNLFFTKPWQRQVKAHEARQTLQRMYQEKFGAEDYARIQEIRGWLKEHPRRGMLLAYLQAEDPYRA